MRLITLFFATSQLVTHLSLEQEVWGSNLESVKSDLGLPTACHCCNILKGAALPRHNDAEMGLANSLHTLRITVSIVKDLI